jgi:hypothetical protein
MKTAGIRTALVVALLAVFAVGACAQGLYWESVVSSDKMPQKEVMKTWYMPKMLKIETGTSGDYAILRLDQEKMYMIRTKNKTFSVMTFADLEKGVKQANEQMDKMREQMKDMPAEQRAAMEKMMGMPGGAKDAKASVKKTGETRTVGGYACTRFKIMKGTDEFADLWVTRAIKGFDAMRGDLAAYSKRMSALNPRMGEDLGKAMETIDGFPMESVAMGMKTSVTKVEPKATPVDAFNPPAGYKQVEMSEMGGNE